MNATWLEEIEASTVAIDTYVAAANEPDAVTRQALVNKSVTEDFELLGPEPHEVCRGRASLVSFLEAMPDMLPPGTVLERASDVDGHHRRVRWSFRYRSPAGTEVWLGEAFCEVREGRLASLALFDGVPPPIRGGGKEDEMSEQNKALARRVVEALNARDLDAADEIFSEDALIQPRGGRGPQAVKDEVGVYLQGFPDLRVEIDYMVAEGDRVMAKITSRGTNTGEVPGWIPATGKAITVNEVDSFRIRGGKIVEAWYLYDQMGLMQQLGLLPPPEAVE